MDKSPIILPNGTTADDPVWVRERDRPDFFLPDDEILLLDDDDDELYVPEPSIDLDTRLNAVDYSYFHSGKYIPTQFALEFINFIKMVNGSLGEENESPIIHYDMLDQVSINAGGIFPQLLFVAFRGSAKTTALHEYMILYLATYGELPGFGPVDVGMYISDTMENGVKSMRSNLEFRWSNSDFLKEYVPEAKFTDIRWQFTNLDGHKTAFRGFGATTGVRGFKEFGKRPVWCGMDDLMSDKNAESPTITKDIKKIVYRAARQALHPTKRIQLWTGTPFNKSDPLYEGASTSAWKTKVYPICEKWPVKKKDFVGGWEDRFPYEFVRNEYQTLKASGEIASFNQELLLRIISEEDALVDISDLVWYHRDQVVRNKSRYNFYITTDFGTSGAGTADYSVLCVWAYSNQGQWLLVDGKCKRQKMDSNIDDLFRFASVYRPLEVGIEINGQQQGFIQWIEDQMVTRNIFFNFAGKGKTKGIRRTGRKIDNFKLAAPLISSKKIWLPYELKTHPLVEEMIEELQYATHDEFKSKNDDVADCISMLLELKAYKPSAAEEPEYTQNEEGTFAYWHDDDEDIYKNSTVF